MPLPKKPKDELGDKGSDHAVNLREKHQQIYMTGLFIKATVF